jgi:hypothetical protein
MLMLLFMLGISAANYIMGDNFFWQMMQPLAVLTMLPIVLYKTVGWSTIANQFRAFLIRIKR